MSLFDDRRSVLKFMDARRRLYDNGRCAYCANNRGVVIKYTLLVAALLAFGSGCAGTEPRVRAGAPYAEEIKSPVPRDALLFGPDCVVR